MNFFAKLLAIILIFSLVSCSTPQPMIVKVQNIPIQIEQMRSSSSANKEQTTIKPMLPQLPQPQQPISSKSFAQTVQQQTTQRSIAILPPRGSGLAENLQYLPDLVQGEFVDNFSRFSGIRVLDRVTLERQYAELLSGYYSDDAGADLGHLPETDYFMDGSITRTATGYNLQIRISRNADKMTAATYSGMVSIAELDNLIGVRRASLELFQQLGINITEQARTALNQAATTDHVNAYTALAQGINAQRQGTEVAALTYFFQAAAFDASLVEAVSRSSVLSANISTGNIGANVRNDIAWRSDWVAKLTETETFINDLLQNTTPQRSIWYTTNVQEHESARDYTRETTELRIEAALHTHAVFPVSMQRTVQAVYDGLQTTERADAWGLNRWPRTGVTNTNPFNRSWGSMVSIDFELINERNLVIGRQTVEMDSRFSFSGTTLNGPATSFTTVRFTGVNANAITDRLDIRIATINGRIPEQAGISQIQPISAQQMQANRAFTVYNGIIRPSSNDRNLGAITIPAELWSESVNEIGNGAFERRGLTRVTLSPGIVIINANAFANNQLTSVTFPSSVTLIGNSAFANNQLSNVSIPSSVLSIGESAFANNRLTNVVISEGVTTIGNKAFADNHWTENVRLSDGSSETRHYGLTKVTIPNSITTIGQEAFASHWTTSSYDSTNSRWITTNYWIVTEVTIGANVNLGNNAFGGGFETAYNNAGRQGGVYRRGSAYSSFWERFDNVQTMEQTISSRNKRTIALGVIGGVALATGLIVLLVINARNEREKEENRRQGL